MATLVQQLGSGSSGQVLYLHGWRTSGEIMKMQCRDVTHGTSSAFLDGAHAATGCVVVLVPVSFTHSFTQSPRLANTVPVKRCTLGVALARRRI